MILIGSAVLVGTISFYLVVFFYYVLLRKTPAYLAGVVFYCELIFLFVTTKHNLLA